ncbi:ABC-type amino acid transport substrate-binding protein [Bradyrhizobium sp. USDA 4448]
MPLIAQCFASRTSPGHHYPLVSRSRASALVANSAAPADSIVSEDALSVEPYGILLRRDDAAFKKVVDDALAAIFRNSGIDKIYAKWFLNSIPPNGINLNVPMSAASRKGMG